MEIRIGIELGIISSFEAVKCSLSELKLWHWTNRVHSFISRLIGQSGQILASDWSAWAKNMSEGQTKLSYQLKTPANYLVQNKPWFITCSFELVDTIFLMGGLRALLHTGSRLSIHRIEENVNRELEPLMKLYNLGKQEAIKKIEGSGSLQQHSNLTKIWIFCKYQYILL